ncbi:hypothetical protein F4861DRAFT_201335 [Xylaria intraflava]|nr:hypothetical protein F4861DRAFT_201335 [Xylaria intraflava]
MRDVLLRILVGGRWVGSLGVLPRLMRLGFRGLGWWRGWIILYFCRIGVNRINQSCLLAFLRCEYVCVSMYVYGLFRCFWLGVSWLWL